MKRGLATIVLTIGPLLTFGQDYLVTLKNDTIKGELRILSYDLVDRVQVGSGKNKQVFTAIQVRLVSMAKKKYQPVKLNGQFRIMELLQPGFMSLFAFRIENQPTYDGRCFVKFGGEAMELPNLTFKKTMSSFFKECENVVEKINNGDWGKKNLDSIVVAYNDCISNKSPNQQQDRVFVALEELKKKVESSDISSKKDVLELVNDISTKTKRKEAVPNFLVEGLKSYLNGKPEFATELDEVINALKN
jgi:hypothetical protein